MGIHENNSNRFITNLWSTINLYFLIYHKFVLRRIIFHIFTFFKIFEALILRYLFTPTTYNDLPLLVFKSDIKQMHQRTAKNPLWRIFSSVHPVSQKNANSNVNNDLDSSFINVPLFKNIAAIIFHYKKTIDPSLPIRKTRKAF